MCVSPSRLLCLIAIVIVAASAALAQTVDPIPSPAEQNEAFRDTLAKMQIQREENEHKKRVEKATQIKETAESLLKDSERGRLASSVDKKLREIEKSARQIRSESGGGNEDVPLETPPGSLKQAIVDLKSLSERLSASMEKTSRRVVSASVVAEASDIIQLVKIIRGYLN